MISGAAKVGKHPGSCLKTNFASPVPYTGLCSSFSQTGYQTLQPCQPAASITLIGCGESYFQASLVCLAPCYYQDRLTDYCT